MNRLIFPALLGATAISSPALAQDHSAHTGHTMPQPAAPATPPPVDHSKMDHSGMDMESAEDCMCNGTPITYAEGSGTARLPAGEGPMKGVHIMSGNWMLMAHGTASLQYTDHKGPRGDSKTYVTSMAMLTAERDTSWGKIQFKSMLSLEPAMDPEGYPNLFATGETAGGLPLV
ncbi:MAG: hypothetical protein ACKOPM_11755, partial [Novosphingobium sp.]